MVWVVAVVVGAAALGGCENFGPSRDFDELIPRLLGAINGKSPEEAARNLFDVTSPDERRDAIAYLEVRSYGHEPPYMRAYELLTTDPHPMVRAQALRALGSSGQAGEAVYLVKGLRDSDVQVRRDAACALITTWGAEATVPLAEMVNKAEEDDQVRIFCARALSQAREPEAFRALIDALRDKDAAVVMYAHDSLVTATKQDFSYDWKAWLKWYSETHLMPATGSGGAAGGGGGVAAPTGAEGATIPATGPRP